MCICNAPSNNGFGPSGATSLAAALTGLVALETVSLRCPRAHGPSTRTYATGRRAAARDSDRSTRPHPHPPLSPYPPSLHHCPKILPKMTSSPTLPSPYRSYNQLGDAGAAAVAAAVAPLAALRELHLEYAAPWQGLEGKARKGEGGGSEQNAAVRKGSRGGRAGKEGRAKFVLVHMGRR